MQAQKVQAEAATLKVVAHKKDGSLVRGFTLYIPEFYKQPFERLPGALPPARLELRLEENGKKSHIDLRKVKALFFVKSFAGSTEYNEIKFFKAHPLLEGLWVRLTFADGECTEGVIYNSLHYLVNPGFFLKPPDPNSNNEIVYVMTNSLRDFRILGVRNSF